MGESGAGNKGTGELSLRNNESGKPRDMGPGNIGTGEHRDWGTSLGNVRTGNSSVDHRAWGTKGLGNIGTGEQRDWGISSVNIRTGNQFWGV